MLGIIQSVPIWSIPAWSITSQAEFSALQGRDGTNRAQHLPQDPNPQPLDQHSPLSAEEKQKASKRCRCRWRGP